MSTPPTPRFTEEEEFTNFSQHKKKGLDKNTEF
jgi:hypothetical protein